MKPQSLGRGEQATQDMKRRIAHLKATDADVIDVLWERNYRATVLQEGYDYGFAEQRPGEVRPAGDSGQ